MADNPIPHRNHTESSPTAQLTMDDDESRSASGSPPPPTSTVFVPPSVSRPSLLSGASSAHFSPVPPSLQPTDPSDPSTAPACCLGVDEAGRGPSIGPMVYGVFYLPLPLSDPLLRDTHGFDDSKVLKAAFRASLMETLCTPGTDLYDNCGWATKSLSARDIAAGQLRPVPYNLNVQAMDATVELIKGVFARGVNIQEIYVDTIGKAETYQDKLQRIFPSTKITVASKADSLYPCVSAASVCAKVTRDVALETMYEALYEAQGEGEDRPSWGSGYPSDARCVNWLKSNMHPVFGWGPECRQSWSGLVDMVEAGVKVGWPNYKDQNKDNYKMSDYFSGKDNESNELGDWFGTSVGLATF